MFYFGKIYFDIIKKEKEWERDGVKTYKNCFCQSPSFTWSPLASAQHNSSDETEIESLLTVSKQKHLYMTIEINKLVCSVVQNITLPFRIWYQWK